MANPYKVGELASSANTNTYTVGVDTPTGPGDQIVLAGGSAATAISNVIDSQGNAYTQVATNAVNQTESVWVSPVNPNPLSATDFFTVTMAATNGNAKVFQASAVPGSTGVDVTPTPVNGSANNTTLSTGVLGQASEVVLSFLQTGSGGGTPTFNNSFTSLLPIQNGTTGPYLTTAWFITSSTSSVTSSTNLQGTATFSQEIVTFKIPTPPPTPVIVNAWPITGQNQYGHQAAKVTNTAGNALVAILGLGSNSQATLPRFNVADDAHNYWQYAGTKSVKFATACRRVDVWVAPNASAATMVSIAESWFTNGVAGMILEVSGFPTYAVVDFIAVNGGFVSSLAMSGTATVSDVVIGGLLISGGSGTPVVTPTGVVDQATVSTGSGSTDMTNQNLYAATVLASAGAFSASWSWTGSRNTEAILVGFKQNPTAPTQPNPNWPILNTEAAFGFQPGDVSAMPAWTDISTRSIDEDGQSVLKTSRGREYELTQAEAGEFGITLDNHDGVFNPTNTASPYYPNVTPECPVRVRATWNGKTYPVGYAYARKWPQNFRDPQYGETLLEGTDTLGLAANCDLPSAYAGEVLIDSPWSYHRLGEDFTVCHGQAFANSSRTNLIPAVGVDDNIRVNGVALVSGQTMNLAGDASTGVGYSGSTATAAGGPGLIYRDNDFPNLDAGFTVEFWAAIPQISAASNLGTLLRLVGKPWNYPANSGAGEGTRLIVEANNTSLNTNFDVFLQDYTGVNTVGFTSTSAIPQDGALHHYVVTVSLSGSTWTVAAYIDGGNTYQNSVTGTSVGSGQAIRKMAIGSVSTGGGFEGSVPYIIGQVATYPYVLDTTRILTHYSVGNSAAKFENVRARFARYNAWGGQGLPLAATFSSNTPQIGPADQVEGDSIATAWYNLTVDEGGMCYCDGWGNVWYKARTAFYNQVPKFALGDRVDVGWMSDGPNIHSCFLADSTTTKAFFNQSTSFISGGTATTDPRTDGLQGTPLLNYTSFAQFKADVTNAPYTQNSVVYNPAGPINSVFRWIRYDLEGGTTWPSPIEEKQDPQTYIANFISLAHANGYKVMLVPARDLGNTDTAHPKLSGESIDQWFIRTNIPAACATGDLFSVQAQADQGQADEFYWFFTQARKLAKAANPNIPVWCGVSTARGNGANMFACAQLASLAEGFWINIIGDTANSLTFMKLVQTQGIEASFLAPHDFGFDDTFLYNVTGSQRTIASANQVITGTGGQFATQRFNSYGVSAIQADQTSQTQYMLRGPLQQDIETTSDQDAYDRANWSLTKYKQPQLRANQLMFDPGSNPKLWPVVLGAEQGDIVSVTRRPIGSPLITLLCIVQKVEHNVGPSLWQTTLTLSPYYPEGNVVQLDNSPYNTLASGVIGW